MLDLRMRSVGLLLIIVSKERSLSLLHGVIFSLSESAAYISVIPGHYLWGKGYSKCLYSQNLYLKTRCGIKLVGSFGSCLAHTRRLK